ncbi:MAG TPA: 50S ribosomal protein L25 [Blastocatellia bacterium]|nr:50S ribosomal protein L25 [Blastocatellia bacterium]
MIKDIVIEAQPRQGVGKGFARRLRAGGLIPGAVYGEGMAPAAVSVSAREIAAILRSDSGHNTIFKLGLPNEEPATVIIKDCQIDPVKGRLLHADFLRLSLTTATRVSVSIVTTGEPVGVKRDAGILEIELRDVTIECLPGDIPERMQVDVSGLSIGQHATVADLIYDRDKIKVITDENHVVAGVIAPRLIETPVAAAPEGEEGAAPSEPEVIKKGKAEEGEK